MQQSQSKSQSQQDILVKKIGEIKKAHWLIPFMIRIQGGFDPKLGHKLWMEQQIKYKSDFLDCLVLEHVGDEDF